MKTEQPIDIPEIATVQIPNKPLPLTEDERKVKAKQMLQLIMSLEDQKDEAWKKRTELDQLHDKLEEELRQKKSEVIDLILDWSYAYPQHKQKHILFDNKYIKIAKQTSGLWYWEITEMEVL